MPVRIMPMAGLKALLPLREALGAAACVAMGNVAVAAWVVVAAAAGTVPGVAVACCAWFKRASSACKRCSYCWRSSCTWLRSCCNSASLVLAWAGRPVDRATAIAPITGVYFNMVWLSDKSKMRPDATCSNPV